MQRINDWLFIGKYMDTIDGALLQRHQIQAMLLLAAPVDHPSIESLYLAVDDGAPITPGLLPRGVEFVKHHHEQQHRILVACGAGISRSATFCIAALKEIEGMDLVSAYRRVRDAQPEAWPHLKLWQSLCDVYTDEPSFDKIMSQLADKES